MRSSSGQLPALDSEERRLVDIVEDKRTEKRLLQQRSLDLPRTQDSDESGEEEGDNKQEELFAASNDRHDDEAATTTTTTTTTQGISSTAENTFSDVLRYTQLFFTVIAREAQPPPPPPPWPWLAPPSARYLRRCSTRPTQSLAAVLGLAGGRDGGVDCCCGGVQVGLCNRRMRTEAEAPTADALASDAAAAAAGRSLIRR